MKDNPIVMKSFAFALRIIKLHRHLVDEHKEFTLSRELLVAGTNIGKHVKEAIVAESRQTFGTGMGVASRKAGGNGILASAFAFRRLFVGKRI